MERADTEKLMNELLPFAKKMLIRFGEFHPFAGYLLDDGRVVHVGLVSDAQGTGSGSARASRLEQQLREIATAVQPLVVGMATHALLRVPANDPRDVVEVDLEHRKGYCADVFFPYRIVDGGQAVELLDATAQAGRGGRFFSEQFP